MNNWGPKENPVDYRLKVTGDSIVGLETRERDIPAALDQLHKTVADLGNVIDALSTRLGPVIKPVPAEDRSEPGCPAPCRSSVANGICEAANSISSLSGRLRALESLVQL